MRVTYYATRPYSDVCMRLQNGYPYTQWSHVTRFSGSPLVTARLMVELRSWMVAAEVGGLRHR